MSPQSSFSIPSSDNERVDNSQTSLSLASLHGRKSDIQSFKGLKLTGRADELPPQLVPARRGPHVLWTEESSIMFETWFNSTPFAKAVQEQNQNLNERKWTLPAWNTARRRAKDSAWSHFHEAADTNKGIPKIVCKYCGTVQNHPGIAREGTSNMVRHLKSSNCKRTGKRPVEAQETLNRHFKKAFIFPFHDLSDIAIISLFTNPSLL